MEKNRKITALKDADHLQDELPQPLCMINKVMNGVIDRAWDVISEGERIQSTEGAEIKVPLLTPALECRLPERTNCITFSEDGTHLFLGHSQGLSVLSASSLTCVTVWQDERSEFISIDCTYIGDSVHLLSTVDDMGVARLFIYSAEIIHLISVINETEDMNQRHICIKLEVSRGGDFGAAIMTCNGAVWLDVYRLPKDIWLKELDAIHGTTQKQSLYTSEASEAKLSPITMHMKIKPPKVHAGTSMKSPFEVLQKTEVATVIGSGQNHLISSRQWEDQEAVFKNMYRKYFSSNPRQEKEHESNRSHCVCHFLFPIGILPNPCETKAPTDVPIALCLWWGDSRNLLQYLLLKPPREKSDNEARPDVLWPNAQEILCSTVSRCTRFIALGLEGHLVTIWDRQLECPHRVVAVPAVSALCRLRLLTHSTERGQDWPFTPKMQVLITCKNRACYILTTGYGVRTNITTLVESTSDPDLLPTAVEPVPFLPKLAVVTLKNGSLSVRALEGGAVVCSLSLPESYQLALPWEPLLGLDPRLQRLYIRGDKNRESSATVLGNGEGKSSLFVFSFPEMTVLDPYRGMLETALEKQPKMILSNLEETCNRYFQERFSTLEKRNRAMAVQWKQLQQHAVAPSKQTKLL